MWNNACGPVSSPWYLWLHSVSSQASGNQLALFHLPSSPLACADLPGPSSAPLCCQKLEPNSVSQWCLPVKCLLTLFLSSQPAFPSSFVCSSFWHEALNISSAPLDFPLCPSSSFHETPLLSVESNWYFLKHIYAKSWCVALCADI